MGKRHDLSLDRFQAASCLDVVRTKRDIILLWMNAIKAFLVNAPPEAGEGDAQLSIVVMSMSRLFCETMGGRKIFSVAFPFSVRQTDGQLRFVSREGVEVDNRVSSQIISVIDSGVLSSVDFSAFIDPLLDAIDVDPMLWALLRELMLAEDAYVGYDWDEQRADGDRHPVHHLDLGYSAGGSFKLGLRQTLDHPTFVSILNVEVDCHYLMPALASNSGAIKR